MKYMLIHCIDEDAERSRRLQDRQPEAPSIESWLGEMEGRAVLLHGDRLSTSATPRRSRSAAPNCWSATGRSPRPRSRSPGTT